MSLIVAVYANSFYKEFHLPNVDDADHTLLLREHEFGFSGGDLILQLEAVDGAWQFRKNEGCRIVRNEADCTGKPLKPGDNLAVKRGARDRAAVLVWSAQDSLQAFRKYRVSGGTITIGKSPENDICWPEQKVLSAYHAELHYQGNRLVLRDLSTNGTYCGYRRVQGEMMLNFGDMVNLFGLTLLCLGDVLAVNGLNGEVRVNSAKLKELTQEDFCRAEESDTLVAEDEPVHISPRSLPKLYTKEETIDNVPQKREGDKRPAWMSILPSFTMMIPMMLGFLLMGSGMGMGIVMSGGSAVVGGVWSVINYRRAKEDLLREENKRNEKYEAYLVECTDRIREKFEFNRASLLTMYPETAVCGAYHAGSTEIWSRKPRQEDFLFLRMGLGDRPFDVSVHVPRRTFSLAEDELSERPEKIADSFAVMHDVPIGVQLREHNVVGIITGGDTSAAMQLLRVLVTQAAANHCYTDVKMAALYSGESETAAGWETLRWLPHIWNEDRSMRYIADDPVGRNEVLHILTQIFRGRKEKSSGYAGTKEQPLPWYVLLVEEPSMLESQAISKYLYEDGAALGVTTLIFSDSYESLPSACDYVIECSAQYHGLYSLEAKAEDYHAIRFDEISAESMEQMARRMSAMRVSQAESCTDVPNSVNFFEMLGVERLDQLSVLEHWRKNRTYESMGAVVGKKIGGQNCILDINEKYHGPHGLVAGTTGSGKSETLQTYILSLAINFSPLDVGFFVIDFKGGGMANLFSNLPHMMGQISNLSGNQVRRAMVSITSENKRRERIFGEHGVKNIDEYTKLVKNKEAAIPIPHLLIIIDEFAELKRENPEFMNELISVSQIGRSLGVHLILATQKPAGTVDDKIWSNTRFKLCLRVADKQDSQEMLHKPDAAYLTRAGRCYMQVGNDEIYELFQSGWSGAVYDESGAPAQNTATLLNLQGRESVSGSRMKTEQRRRKSEQSLTTVVRTVEKITDGRVRQAVQNDLSSTARNVIRALNESGFEYAETASNLHRMERLLQLWPENTDDEAERVQLLTEQFALLGERLPEPQEKTQLDAVVDYLAELAHCNGFENEQPLWMPLLPEQLVLSDLSGYREGCFDNGTWPSHGNFRINGMIGLVDDPENQMQYPLSIDLTEKGHLIVAGGATGGKSTFLQSYLFGLLMHYSPAELNLYAIDYSSQMLCALEGAPHVGGVVVEGEDERMEKLFTMLSALLDKRKKQLRGGSFLQYAQANPGAVPAVVLAIDGYANFNEKTEGKYEPNLLELSRTAEGYGIYLVITCGSIGSGDLPNRIAANMRQGICLELGDKYRYAEILHVNHFDVLPEQNVKGRGLALVNGSVLEFQTAQVCRAATDYARSEEIVRRCDELNHAWSGRKAAPIPEIPEKPEWAEFSSLDAYAEAIEQGLQPLGYDRKTAGVYSIDPAAYFCYLLLGTEHCGKSVFLQNMICSAQQLGGRTILIDPAGGELRAAQLPQVQLAADPAALVEVVRELIELTNERAVVRNQLRGQGLDDVEILEKISEQFAPVWYFISDLKAFCDLIYTNTEGIGCLNSWFENILAKGQLLNVRFVAAANLSGLTGMMDKMVYSLFIRDRAGVMLGGEPDKQTVFPTQSLPFAERSRRIKTGTAYVVVSGDEQGVEQIIVPNHKNRGAAV